MVVHRRLRRRVWALGAIGAILLGGLAVWGIGRVVGDGNTEAPNRPESVPVLVYLLSPTAGSAPDAGDTVAVTVQATAADGVANTEVFVDGRSLGAVDGPADREEWDWLAWPAGVHTVQARATDTNGVTAQSPAVIVNVRAQSSDLVITPADGQRLDDVAAAYDLPAEIVVAANPQFSPTHVFGAGDTVRLPVAAPAQAAGGIADGSAAPQIVTTWTVQTPAATEQAYCYVSTGLSWERVPAEPFRFFTGDGQQTYPDTREGLVRSGAALRSQCWGWVGGVLTYLGDGEMDDVYRGDPAGATIATDAFTLVGQPELSIPVEQFTAGGGPKSIPPPYAVRETSDVGECTKHHGNLLAGFICDALLNAPLKEFRILVWEWSSDQCWANECVDDIDGYRVYQVPSLGSPDATLVGTITNPGQRVLAVPLFLGYTCYGVDAYSDDPAVEASTISTFCPGEEPVTESISLSLEQWLTVGGTWIQDGDCDTYGSATFQGLGTTPKVKVGSYIVDDDEEDCYREGDWRVHLKFASPVLAPGAVVQSAELRFHDAGTQYDATALATNEKPLCASAVRRADSEWTASVPPSHWVKSLPLTPGPQVATVGWAPAVDVTGTVGKWVENPATNHGLMLMPRSAPHPLADGAGSCISFLDGFVLDLTYFTP